MNKLYLRRDDCNCGPSPCWSSFSYRAATPPFPAVDRFGRAVGGSGSAWVLHGARFLAGFLVGCFARFFGRLTGSFVALSGSGPTVVSLLVRGTHRVFFVRTLSSRCPSALMLDAPKSTRSQTSSPSPPELGDCTGDTAAGEGSIVAWCCSRFRFFPPPAACAPSRLPASVNLSSQASSCPEDFAAQPSGPACIVRFFVKCGRGRAELRVLYMWRELGFWIAPILPGGVFRVFRIDRVRRVVGGGG